MKTSDSTGVATIRIASGLILLLSPTVIAAAPAKWGTGVTKSEFFAAFFGNFIAQSRPATISLPGADLCASTDRGNAIHCQTRFRSSRAAEQGWKEIQMLARSLFPIGKTTSVAPYTLLLESQDDSFSWHVEVSFNTKTRTVVIKASRQESQTFEARLKRVIPGISSDVKIPRPSQRERTLLKALQYSRDFDPVKARLAALARVKEMAAFTLPGGASPGRWEPIGPRPTLQAKDRYGAWTSSIVTDPSDSLIAYSGNPGSGVWKTSDGGTTWLPKTDSAPALSIGALAVSPSDPSVVYAGTGNWWDGVGMLKSTDRGETWKLLPGIFSTLGGNNQFWSAGYIFNSIAVSPKDPNTILAGVWNGRDNLRGIFRSTDGGLKWTQVFSGGAGTSIVWDPRNGITVFAAVGEYYTPQSNGIYKSVDGGITWKSSSAGIDPALFPNSKGIILTMCDTQPNALYASIPGRQGGTLGVFRTSDGAATWVKITTPPAERALQVVVHPQDPNTIMVGDVALFRSRDGGQNWDRITVGRNGVSTFGDYRAFAYTHDGEALFAGSDGGIFRTTDARNDIVDWTSLNDTLQTTLFYPGSPISIHPTDVTVGFGGAQDLGILRFSGSVEWQRAQGCDGGTSIIDPVNPANVYATCNGPAIFKSTEGGSPQSFQLAITGIDLSERIPFVPTIGMDPNNPRRLFFGGTRLYQSLDSAATWTAISPDISKGCYIGVTTIGTTAADSNTIYAGSRCTAIYVSTNSRSATPSWTDRSRGLPSGRDLTRIVVDPRNAAVAWATFSGFTFSPDNQGHVFRTSDYGQSWVDVSGNLPNIPANDLALDPDFPNTLYLATDIGVLATSDGGVSWSPLSDGLPNAYVENLGFHQPSRILRAATLGRGMWDLYIPRTPTNLTPSLISLSPQSLPSGSPTTVFTVDGQNFTPSSTIKWNETSKKPTYVNSNQLRFIASEVELAQPGSVTLTVVNPTPGGGISNEAKLTVESVAPLLVGLGIVNAASYSTGAIAPDELVSLLGTGLSNGIESASSADLSAVLGQTSVTFRDGSGNEAQARLSYASPSQINLRVPPGLQPGPGTITLEKIPGGRAELPIMIASIAPGLFTANASGKGAPAGQAIVTRHNGGQTVEPLYSCSTAPGDCVPAVLDYSDDVQDIVFVLYGTGIRGAKLVQAQLGGVNADVLYAGPQGSYLGLDQVNLRVPKIVAAGSALPISVTADGLKANELTASFRTPQLAGRDCAEEGRLRSIEGAVPSTISLRNATSATRKLYWLNYQGKRTSYGIIAPANTATLLTYLTHSWVITDADDACVAVFTSVARDGTAVITK